MKVGKFLFLIIILSGNLAFSQIVVNEKRIVLDRNKENTHSVIIANRHDRHPFLSQIWIEDEEGKQIDFPIIALPFLQRAEPGRSYQVKISTIGDLSSIADDRESLFYFNVMGVPPKEVSSETGGIQFLIHYKIKLFYRPKGLMQYSHYNNEWIQEAVVTRLNNKIVIDNKSQYYLDIMSYGTEGAKLKNIDLLIKPFSKGSIDASLGKHIRLNYISDRGKTIGKSYVCEKLNEPCK